MCKGFILGTKPFILGIVAFKAHLEAQKLPPPLVFLVDTGAEKTMISAGDAEKLDISYQPSADGMYIPYFDGQPLEKGPIMGGIGGKIQTFIVPEVTLWFITVLNDLVELHVEHLDSIHVPEGKVREIPSLLGWDILGSLEQRWSPASGGQGIIEFSRIVKIGIYHVTYMERTVLGL